MSSLAYPYGKCSECGHALRPERGPAVPTTEESYCINRECGRYEGSVDPENFVTVERVECLACASDDHGGCYGGHCDCMCQRGADQ